jgi:hypothetical protein
MEGLGVSRRKQVTAYLSLEEDQALVAYLDRQHNVSAAIRRLLKAGFRCEQAASNSAAVEPVEVETITQAIERALSAQLSPALFRQIVEAGVSDALSGLQLPAVTETATDELDDGLDSFVL